MSKKNLYTILSILTIAAIAIGVYLSLAPEKYLELKLSPNPGRMTAGNAIIIDFISINQGLSLEAGTATIKFDQDKFELEETTGKADGNQIKFTISKEEINKSGEQKIGSLKIKSKESGTGVIELAESSISSTDQENIIPRFIPGLYAASVSISPTGESSQ